MRRDLPGLQGLLNRAASRAAQPPTYRFHGHRSPTERPRTPVLAQGPQSNTADGVAKLRLYDPIDSWGGPWGVSASEFVDVIDDLPSDVEEIRLHINSPGGEVYEALAILNTLRAHDSKLVAVVDGLAASCASFIACAADETIMSPNTQLMIHDAWALAIGNEATMLDAAAMLGRTSDNIASIYAGKSGDDVATWRATMKDEAWYSAQEAVDSGLADSVAGSEPSEDPADAFDLSQFRYRGRDEAPAPAAKSAPAPAEGLAPVPGESASAHRRNGLSVAGDRHGLRA